MKTTVIMILLAFISISCIEKANKSTGIIEPAENVKTNLNTSDSNDYFYKSDSLNIQLSVLKRTQQIEFDICINTVNDTFNLKSDADLILIEDENGKLYAPEGSLILDAISNEEYLCDSTYEYVSEQICFSFGFEKLPNKRICMVIYNSQISFIKENEFTLYKKSDR